ncbi:hypothetical protein [Henriciella mobilis]|jgi:hypothetical protein|uniref:hypothetical protein n=1 Tax=Henriciella mobilis TaxID=2305467 RepID=UPI001F24DE2C|nr:hypothetical protein [Henriciella mobilis]
MNRIRTYLPHAIALVASLVFLDSLRFKFTNAVETQVIFGKLNAWASSLGAPGLFAPTGLFSQYVIGSAELVASALLLVGIHPALRRFQAVGALVAFAVMSGAVNFHLWTPLGIDPNNDGGGLFFMACTVWVTSIVLIVIRRRELAAIGQGLAATFLPGRGADAGASASPGAVPANSN